MICKSKIQSKYLLLCIVSNQDVILSNYAKSVIIWDVKLWKMLDSEKNYLKVA